MPVVSSTGAAQLCTRWGGGVSPGQHRGPPSPEGHSLWVRLVCFLRVSPGQV